jgi:hypothetical protein
MTTNRRSMTNWKCECCDPGCPEHKGQSECFNSAQRKPLRRIDMDDVTGTLMCEACADDAMSSGLF